MPVHTWPDDRTLTFLGPVSLAIGAATLLLAVDPRRSTTAAAAAAGGGQGGGYAHLPTDEGSLALGGQGGQCGEGQGEDKEHGARRRRHHRRCHRGSPQQCAVAAGAAAARTAVVPVYRTGVGALKVPEVAEEGEGEEEEGAGEGGGSGGSGRGRDVRGGGDGDEGDVEWGGGASSSAAEKEPLVGPKCRRGQGNAGGAGAAAEAASGAGGGGLPRVADLGCPAPHLLPTPRRPLLSLQHDHRHPHSSVRHKAAAGGREGNQATAHRSGWLFSTAAPSRAKATGDPQAGSPAAGGKGAAGGWDDTAQQREAEHGQCHHVVGCAVEGGGADAAVAAAALGSSGRRPLTWGRMRAMLTTPTFLIIILQVGGLGWPWVRQGA